MLKFDKKLKIKERKNVPKNQGRAKREWLTRKYLSRPLLPNVLYFQKEYILTRQCIWNNTAESNSLVAFSFASLIKINNYYCKSKTARKGPF